MIVWIFLFLWWMLWLVPLFLREAQRRWYIICIIPFLVWSGYRVGSAYYAVWYDTGIIIQEVAVRVGPGEEHGSCGTIQPGTCVLLVQEQGGWVCVRADMLCGWIPRAGYTPGGPSASEVV